MLDSDWPQPWLIFDSILTPTLLPGGCPLPYTRTSPPSPVQEQMPTEPVEVTRTWPHSTPKVRPANFSV